MSEQAPRPHNFNPEGPRNNEAASEIELADLFMLGEGLVAHLEPAQPDGVFVIGEYEGLPLIDGGISSSRTVTIDSETLSADLASAVQSLKFNGKMAVRLDDAFYESDDPTATPIYSPPSLVIMIPKGNTGDIHAANPDHEIEYEEIHIDKNSKDGDYTSNRIVGDSGVPEDTIEAGLLSIGAMVYVEDMQTIQLTHGEYTALKDIFGGVTAVPGSTEGSESQLRDGEALKADIRGTMADVTSAFSNLIVSGQYQEQSADSSRSTVIVSLGPNQLANTPLSDHFDGVDVIFELRDSVNLPKVGDAILRAGGVVAQDRPEDLMKAWEEVSKIVPEKMLDDAGDMIAQVVFGFTRSRTLQEIAATIDGRQNTDESGGLTEIVEITDIGNNTTGYTLTELALSTTTGLFDMAGGRDLSEGGLALAMQTIKSFDNTGIVPVVSKISRDNIANIRHALDIMMALDPNMHETY